jgi:hypothetical protein
MTWKNFGSCDAEAGVEAEEAPQLNRKIAINAALAGTGRSWPNWNKPPLYRQLSDQTQKLRWPHDPYTIPRIKYQQVLIAADEDFRFRFCRNGQEFVVLGVAARRID